MKKYFSAAVSYLVTCVFALCMLWFIWLVSSGAMNTDGKAPIYFTENGSILSFFGEPLCISRSTVENIAEYPLRCAGFCAEFLPESLERPLRKLGSELYCGGAEFTSFAVGALKAFFTIGLFR